MRQGRQGFRIHLEHTPLTKAQSMVSLIRAPGEGALGALD